MTIHFRRKLAGIVRSGWHIGEGDGQGAAVIDELRELFVSRPVLATKSWIIRHPIWAAVGLVALVGMAITTPAYQQLLGSTAWWVQAENNHTPEQLRWAAFVKKRKESAVLALRAEKAVFEAYQRAQQQVAMNQQAGVMMDAASAAQVYEESKTAFAQNSYRWNTYPLTILGDRLRKNANDPAFYDRARASTPYVTAQAVSGPNACRNNREWFLLEKTGRRLTQNNLYLCGYAVNLDYNVEGRLGLEDTDVTVINYIFARYLELKEAIPPAEVVANIWDAKIFAARDSLTEITPPELYAGDEINPDILGNTTNREFRREGLMNLTTSEIIGLRNVWSIVQARAAAERRMVAACRAMGRTTGCGF